MDPAVAAKMVLASVHKPMNRFLKFMRLHPFHPAKEIAEHLQRCLAYGFSARSFLERLFSKRLPNQVSLSSNNCLQIEPTTF
jgi:hypothetical protein